MANASAGQWLHAAKLLWLWETGSAWAGHDAPAKRLLTRAPPAPRHAPALVCGTARWAALYGHRGRLRREPNFKVMEGSQDQREGMNFKHVLLYFEKLKS